MLRQIRLRRSNEKSLLIVRMLLLLLLLRRRRRRWLLWRARSRLVRRSTQRERRLQLERPVEVC